MLDCTRLAQRMEVSLLSVDQVQAQGIVDAADSMAPLDLVEKIIVPAMERVGAGWEAGNVALSQVYMSARICEKLVDRITITQEQLRTPQPRMAIAVLEDYHLLGKSIIHSVMRGGGYQILDFGRQDADELADKVRAAHVEILLVSTLMLRAAMRVPYLRSRVNALAGERVKIIVGGAPFRFDKTLWLEVGADATAAGAAELLPIIKQMTGRE